MLERDITSFRGKEEDTTSVGEGITSVRRKKADMTSVGEEYH